MYFDSMNRLWVGTWGGGICMYDGHAIDRSRVDGDQHTGYFISAMTETDDGQIWALSELGISSFNGFGWQLDTMTQLKPNASLFSYDGKVRLWTGSSLLDFSPGQTANRWKLSPLSSPGTDLVIPSGEGAFIRIKGSQATLMDRGGRESTYKLPAEINGGKVTGGTSFHKTIHLATDGAGVVSCSNGRCRIVPGSLQGNLRGIIRDPDGGIWFFNDEGQLFGLKGGMVVRKPGPEGAIRNIALDRDGNIWFGMDNGNLLRYLREPYRLVNLPGNYDTGVRRLYLDEQDNVWVIDGKGNIWHFNGTSPDPELVDSGAGEAGFSDLTRLDANRDLLLSTNGMIRVYGKQAGEGQPILQLDSTQKWLQLERDLQRNLWVLSDEDLFRGSYTIGSGFPFLHVSFEACGWTGSKAIQAIHVDRRNRVWWHTRDEIGWYQNGRFYPLDIPGFFGDITCWVEDESGLLWVGTAGAGLYVVELYRGNPEMKMIRNQPGQNWPVIRNLVVDQDQLFLTTAEKVYRYQVDRPERRMDGRKLVGDIEGIESMEFIPEAMGIDRFGRLFIGTNRGTFWLSLTSDTESSGGSPPLAYIQYVGINFENIYRTGYANRLGAWNRQVAPMRFKPGDQDLHFVFSAADYYGKGNTMFRWRLAGPDADWSPPALQNEVFFPDLNPGQYQFEVQACRENEPCSDKKATFSFQILPHWYQRWWFYGGLGCLGILLAGSVITTRNKRLRRELTREREKMHLEHKALDLQRKALQLQMNPHFLFNAMNTIQSEINADSFQEAKVHLAKFSRLMRQVLESSRKETTTLEEEIELLDHYIAISELSRGMKIRFEVNLSEGIEPDLVEIPTMMLQPFVENAIQHGFNGLEEGTIRLDVSYRGKNLLVRIEDDGLGIDEEQGNREGSVALHVIRERLEMMKRPGKVEIRQLHPDAETRKGTIVILKLTLE